jgi:uncharacterized protein (TIGR03435 family)
MQFPNFTRLANVVWALASLCIAHAQSPQSFDAAAIRPDTIGAGPGTGFDFNGASLKITNATLQYLIRTAYRIQGDQIVGGPGWLDSDRYDIEAKTGATERIPPEQFGKMLQNLLADRFGLTTHRETRQMTVFALVVDKSGSKLKEDTEGGVNRLNTEMGSGKAILTGTRESMEQLAGYIGDKLGRVVVDETGLKRLRFHVRMGPGADYKRHRAIDVYRTAGANGTPSGIAESSG